MFFIFVYFFFLFSIRIHMISYCNHLIIALHELFIWRLNAYIFCVLLFIRFVALWFGQIRAKKRNYDEEKSVWDAFVVANFFWSYNFEYKFFKGKKNKWMRKNGIEEKERENVENLQLCRRTCFTSRFAHKSPNT